MRGKRPWRGRVPSAKRITPADAGKTTTQRYIHPDESDHPRGCGENVRAAENFDFSAGSPPRMRGKLYVGVTAGNVRGITPADAGKTAHAAVKLEAGMDHPRGCGENSSSGWPSNAVTGSPPRMRGKPTDFICLLRRHRITPADAGKTCQPQHSNRNHRDHPRGCGEN